MKALITILLTVLITSIGFCQGITLCTDEVNQNGFFIRKCVILPENDFGGNENSVKSGVSFQYLIWFTLPEGATEVVITDIIPSELEILNTIPDADIDPTTNTVTYEVPAGTASNTAQSLAINVKFHPGTTCGGTSVSNKVGINADQLSQALLTDEIEVEAFAVNPFAMQKTSTLPLNPQTNIYKGVVGQPVTYILNIYKPTGYYYNDIGQQDLENIFIYDIIPEHAELVGNVYCNGAVVDVTPGIGFLMLDCSDLILHGALFTPSLLCKLQILYPEAYFPLDAIIDNEASYTGYSCGEIEPVSSNAVQVQFGEASPGGTATKSVLIINPVSGCVGNYWLTVDNNGNVLLDHYTIEDATPVDVEITMIKLFRSTLDPSVPITFTIDGEDPIVFNTVNNHTILFEKDENSTFPPGGTFTIKRGDESHPVEMGSNCRYQIEFLVGDDPILPAGHEISNTASFTFTFDDQPLEPTIAEASFEIEEFQPKVCLYKTICNPQNSYMFGDIIRYRFTIQNKGSDYLSGAIIEDLLDGSLEYFGNEMKYFSETLESPCSDNGVLPQGATEWTGVTSDHNSNNLKWESIEIEPYCEVTNTWVGNGCNPTGITYYFIEFDAKVTQDASAGTVSNTFIMSGGGLHETAESSVAYITINNVFGVNAEKFISNDNGLSWHKTLEINKTDDAMFRLQLTNNSNYPVTEIIMMDLLPMNYSSSEDRMILDRENIRGSQFGLLYDATDIPEISTNPESINFGLPIVSVDNFDNICTQELLYSPLGCNQPDWSNNTGKNVKFDFGDEHILPPGATLNCDFKVHIPENALSGLIACNSFAVRSSGFFTIGDETITIDNIASESDVICLKYVDETGNDLLCEEPVFFWTEKAGGTKNYLDYAWGNAVVTDADKNVYTTGGFSGTVVFPNDDVLSSADAESKIFVAKQNEVGDFLWVRELGDIGFNEGRSIVISPTGDVYITGIKSFFEEFNSVNIPEAFVAKIDGANGEVIICPVSGFSYWPSAGNDIAISPDGKVYITGYECTWLKSGNAPNSSYCGWDDVLIKKFDSDLNILPVSGIVNFGGNGIDAGNGIAVDADGNIFITGLFEQTVNFNPDWQGTPAFETSIGGRDIFLIKLDQNFGLSWLATIGGEEEDIGSDIAIDESGDIYITGWASKSSVNVAGFDILHNPDGICDGIVSKWSSGGTCIWTKFMEGENDNDFSKGFSIEIGPDQAKVFTTGLFSGTVNFNPGISNPISASIEDMFIVKLATDDGSYFSNLTNQALCDNGILPGVHSIAVDNNGCLYTTGGFIEADFDPMNGNSLLATGMKDFFVQKLCCCCPNEADFLNRIAKGFKVEIDPPNCKVTVTLDQFSGCHWMSYPMPDWGDGSTIQAILAPANGSWSHVYEQSGEYEICTTIYEIDENGDFCYSGQICTTVELDCFLYDCVDITICCTDPPVFLSENAPEGAVFSGEFVTVDDDGDFYFTPNCDDFPPPTPPYPGLFKEYDISYTYFDGAGIAHNCIFTITVDANTPPPPDCPGLDTIVCLDSEPFWLGIIYIDPLALGVGTHYFDCYWTNACGSWGWDSFTIPPAPQVRRKVTTLAPGLYPIPDVTVCEDDPPFWHWGFWIVPNQLNIGNNTIHYGENAVPPVIYKDPCGNIINGTFNVKVLSSLQCPVAIDIDFPDYSWCIISSYVQPITPYPLPEPSPIIDIFEPEIYLGHFEVALGKSGILWPSGSINTIGNWDVYQGYKVKMNEPGWIEISGEIPEDKTITLNAGANYIPVLSQEFYPAMDIFAQLGSAMIFAYDLNTELLYWPQGGINSLDVLEPGKGYLVGMTQPGQATYEPMKANIQNHKPARSKVYENAPWNITKSGSIHFISIKRSALGELAMGDFIGVFNSEGVCAGLTQVDEADGNILLVAYGNDFTEKSNTGLADGENMTFRIFHAATGAETKASVSFDAAMPNTGLYAENGLSMIVNIKTGAASIAENDLNKIRIYPNPTDGTFTIEGTYERINLRIFNAFGREIYGSELNLPAKVNLSAQPKGIYFVKVETDKRVFYEKLVIN